MRNPGRLVAPIAIAAVAVGTYLIVEANVGSRPTSAVHATHRRARPAHGRASARSHRAARPATYTVRGGDTLSDIAQRTGVSLARLEALNPSLGPTDALHVGQRLRLRR